MEPKFLDKIEESIDIIQIGAKEICKITLFWLMLLRQRNL